MSLIYLLLLFFLIEVQTSECPTGCKCHLRMKSYYLDCTTRSIDNVFSTADTDIEQLVLAANKIEEITNYTFSDPKLRSLRRLQLKTSNLRVIQDYAFSTLTQLTRLKIGKTKLTCLHENIFSGLENLETLYVLQQEKLSMIDQKAFWVFKNLKKLYLHAFDLILLHDEMFKKLKKIEIIHINGNSQLSIKGVFSNLESLKTLNIDGKLMNIDQYSFLGLINLESLQLTVHNLTKITNNHFKDLKNLKYLNLMTNKIKIIENEAFSGLLNLKSLTLSKNDIQTLPKDIFANNDRLESLRLDDNEIELLDKQIFHGLVNLEILSIRKNSLTSIKDDTLQGLVSLKYLYLDHNNIVMFDANALSGSTNLMKLDLSYNNLTSIHVKNNENRNISSKITTKHNNTRFDNGTYLGLNSLTSLKIDHNRLTRLHPEFINRFISLKNLEINHNHLTTIEPNTLKNLSKLDNLNIGNNYLKSIRKKVFSDLVNLKSLTLTQNEIHGIHYMAFNNLTKLTSLKIDKNRLTNLNVDTFKELTKLYYLYLNDNNIRYIDFEIFTNLQKLSALKLSNNSLTCSCHLLKSIKRSTIRMIYINCFLQGKLHDASRLTCDMIHHGWSNKKNVGKYSKSNTFQTNEVGSLEKTFIVTFDLMVLNHKPKEILYLQRGNDTLVFSYNGSLDIMYDQKNSSFMLRKNSVTLAKWYSVEISETEENQLFVFAININGLYVYTELNEEPKFSFALVYLGEESNDTFRIEDLNIYFKSESRSKYTMKTSKVLLVMLIVMTLYIF